MNLFVSFVSGPQDYCVVILCICILYAWCILPSKNTFIAHLVNLAHLHMTQVSSLSDFSCAFLLCTMGERLVTSLVTLLCRNYDVVWQIIGPLQNIFLSWNTSKKMQFTRGLHYPFTGYTNQNNKIGLGRHFIPDLYT